MRVLLERLEDQVGQLDEATANAVYRKTPRAVKNRGDRLRPKLVARTGEDQRTFWYETKGATTPGKTWYQTVKVHPRPNSRKQLIAGIDVTMKCTCPAWVYSGAQWWALQEGYLYGLPRPKVRKPKLERNLSPRAPLCKHMTAVVEHMKRRKTKLDLTG
jgi:hypothetical protein